ncbi:transcriptional regulator [Planctomycetota bacterium]|nr:transcriptional regulator [Planctomycetota bacterium]
MESPCCPPQECTPGALLATPLDGAEDTLAALAKALGNPVRIRILRLLVARNACICGEIVEEMPLSQSTISAHLKFLKDVGLVQGTIDGPRVCYCVNPAVLKQLKILVACL